MININNFVIKSDGDNWIVFERKTNQDESSKNFGKEYLSNPAYYGRIEHMAAYLLRQVESPEGDNLTMQLTNLQRSIDENTLLIIEALKAVIDE